MAIVFILMSAPGVAQAQGSLVNGENHNGAIAVVGETDSWTFTATQGDSIFVSAAEPGADTLFYPSLRLYAPNGASIGVGSPGGYVVATIGVGSAPATGTYTVIVSSSFGQGQPGNYVVRLAHTPGGFVVPSGDEGGALTNGANQVGSILIGDLDLYSFTASQGDSILVTVAEPGADTLFYPSVQLLAPNGASIGVGNPGGYMAATIGAGAPASGTYTVVVTSSFGQGSPGDYVVRLAHAPRGFVVPAGDEGGVLKNGASHSGFIPRGDVDLYSFTAAQGDSISLAIGEVGDSTFYPTLSLLTPNGASIGAGTFGGYRAGTIGATAPLTGTYTVLVTSSGGTGDAGQYTLTLAHVPGAFVVSPGDEGGPIAAGVTYQGATHWGDLDVWWFRAMQGNSIHVAIDEAADTPFYPSIRLISPTGQSIGAGTFGGYVSAYIAAAAPVTGIYAVVASSSFGEGSPGTYRLTVTGIPSEPRRFSYAALGDSYSSGEGLFPYTDTPNPLLGCHRSVRAYSSFVRRPGTIVPIAWRDDSDFDFIACSGATTANVTATGDTRYGDPPQLAAINRVDASRDLVTISIGGNDAQFARIVGYCLMHPSCHDARPFSPYLDVKVQDFFPLLVAVVKEKLRAVHAEVRTATPNAATLVLGYPILLSGTLCDAVKVPSSESELSAPEQAALRDANVQLNAAVQQAAAEIGLHFVPVADRFAGHEICGQADDWINGLALYNPAASFHPTTIGQLVYAAAINDYLESTSTGWPHGYLPNGLPRNPAPAAPTRPEMAGTLVTLPDVGELIALRASPPTPCRAVNGVVVPGESVRITGAGFAPQEVVSLSFVVSNQTVPLGTTIADLSGNIDATVLLPGSTPVDTAIAIEALAAGPGGQGHLLIGLARTSSSADGCYAAPPTLTAMTPATGSLGEAVSITLTGTNLSLPLAVDAGAGITVSIVAVIASTSATATLTVDVDASLGVRTVRVTTLAGTSDPASFTVSGSAPQITVHPQSQTIQAGHTTPLSVAASGSPVLTFQWYSGPSGVTSAPIAGATTSAFTPPAMTAAVNLFWVRVSNGLGGTDSTTATVTVVPYPPFTDNLLTAGSSEIRGVHVTELQMRINTQRTRFLLGSYAYTGSVIVGRVTVVRAQHILEMRAALAQAYSAAGRTAPIYTDPTLGAGMPIRAIHVQELRTAVIALEMGYP